MISIRSNTTATNTISAYAAGKLIAIDKTMGAGSAAPVSGGLCTVLDRIAVTFTYSGDPSSLKGRLYWDAAGDHPMTEEFTFSYSFGLTTSATGTATYRFSPGVVARPPSQFQTAQHTLYLGLAAGANNVSVAASSVELWSRDDATSSG